MPTTTTDWAQGNQVHSPKTYFGIYYIMEATVTVVVAVQDLRQDPGAIRQPLSGRVEI
jgi:hypothetical protein